VSGRVRDGRLHRVHRGVYAVGHSRLSEHGWWMAAVLAAGPRAVLSHLAAARLWEIWRRRVVGIDVLAPRRLRARSGFRAHSCRRLDPRDVTVRDGIPVTTVARTLVDLTDVLEPYQLANVIHEAAFRRRFDEHAARAAMTRAPGRRLTVLEAALRAHANGSAGTRSGLEDRFIALAREAGLPEPLVNTHVPAGGRTFEVDFHWPALGLCVEVDGGGHARPRSRSEDRARDAALRAAGQRVVRLSEDDLEDPAARRLVLAGAPSIRRR
jgi:very-short-patch-repair endonuclease